MLKVMDELKRDDEEWAEVLAEEVEENVYEYEDERGKKRRVYYEEDDDVLVYGEFGDGGGRFDDLGDVEGILADVDRDLEDCQIALERLQHERARALQDNHLALYLALDTKVAQLSGYVQGLADVRERLGGGAPKLELPEGDDPRLSLAASQEAQAKLDLMVKRIEKLLARRPEQQDVN